MCDKAFDSKKRKIVEFKRKILSVSFLFGFIPNDFDFRVYKTRESILEDSDNFTPESQQKILKDLGVRISKVNDLPFEIGNRTLKDFGFTSYVIQKIVRELSV